MQPSPSEETRMLVEPRGRNFMLLIEARFSNVTVALTLQ